MMAMRTIRPGRVFTRGRRLTAGAVALLAALGVAGGFPSAAQAGSSAGPTWTRQATVTHPPGEVGTMAYDAATGTVVVFTNATAHSLFGETWTWDGSTWTRRFPATRPPARGFASMAYDAATRTVVLFGGQGQRRVLNDTWTWDGSTWARQAPATHPAARSEALMAYDAATGTPVLLGGTTLGPPAHMTFHDTWTWG